MVDITIVSGSTMGNAEYIAEYVAALLKQQGLSTNLFHGANLSELKTQGLWLIVTSTYGSGELPKNLQPLLDDLIIQSPLLSSLTFGAIGIGCSDYDKFCGAIDTLEQKLTALGATRIGNVLKIDVNQYNTLEELVKIWIMDWLIQVKI